MSYDPNNAPTGSPEEVLGDDDDGGAQPAETDPDDQQAEGGDIDSGDSGGGGSSSDDSGSSSSSDSSTSPSDSGSEFGEPVGVSPEEGDTTTDDGADPEPTDPDDQQAEGGDIDTGGSIGSSDSGTSDGSTDPSPSDPGSEFGETVDVSPEEGDTTTEDGAQPGEAGFGADTEQRSEGAEDPAATPSDPAPDSPTDFTGVNEPTEGDAPNPTGATSAPPEVADTTQPGGVRPGPASGQGPRTTADVPGVVVAAQQARQDYDPGQAIGEGPRVSDEARLEARESVAEQMSQGPGPDVSPADVTVRPTVVDGQLAFEAEISDEAVNDLFRAAPMGASVTADRLEATRSLFETQREAAEGRESDLARQQFQEAPMAAGPTAEEIEAGRDRVAARAVINNLDGGPVQTQGPGDLPASPAAARAAVFEAATGRVAPDGGPIFGPAGNVERAIYAGTEDIAIGLQEEVVDPVSDLAGDVIEARRDAEAVQAGLDPRGEALETSSQDILRAPEDELEAPGTLEYGTERFVEGGGDIIASLPQAPEAVRNVSVLGFDAAKFTARYPAAAPAAAAGFAVDRLSTAYEQAIENPIRTGGQLAGSALLMGGAAALSSRAGLASRAAIQPGEEAIGYGGAAAFRGAGSAVRRAGGAVETVGDVSVGMTGRAIGAGGTAIRATGGGIQRAGRVLFPRNEPLLMSEEAGIATVRAVGGGAVRGARGARDVITGRRPISDLGPTPRRAELTSRFRPGTATETTAEEGAPGARSEPLGGGGVLPEAEVEQREMLDRVENEIEGRRSVDRGEVNRAELERIASQAQEAQTFSRMADDLGVSLEAGRSELRSLREDDRGQVTLTLGRTETEPEVEPEQEPFSDFDPEAQRAQELEQQRSQFRDFGSETERERERVRESRRTIESEAERERERARTDVRMDVLQDLDLDSRQRLRGLEDILEREAPALDLELELEQETETELELETETEQEFEWDPENEFETETEPERELETEFETETEVEVEGNVFDEIDDDPVFPSAFAESDDIFSSGIISGEEALRRLDNR